MSAPTALEWVFPNVDPGRARIWPLQIIAEAVAPHGVAAIEPQQVRLATQPLGTFGYFVAFTLDDAPSIHAIRGKSVRSQLRQADVATFLRLFGRLDLDAMEEDDLKMGFDGCTYVIDVHVDGLHKTIVRWSPDDSRIKDLFHFAANCCYEYGAR